MDSDSMACPLPKKDDDSCKKDSNSAGCPCAWNVLNPRKNFIYNV